MNNFNYWILFCKIEYDSQRCIDEVLIFVRDLILIVLFFQAMERLADLIRTELESNYSIMNKSS